MPQPTRQEMKVLHTSLCVATVAFLYSLTLVSANDVHRRFFLPDVGEFTKAKLREIARNFFDPKPFEPAMILEAKRVRARIGHTLANVTNDQLNNIVVALDKMFLTGPANPALSTLVFDIRRELGEKSTYLTDTEIGNVVYDLLCQTSPIQDVVDLVKVVPAAASLVGVIGG